MSLVKAHRNLRKRFAQQFELMSEIFFSQDKRKCHTIVRDCPKLFDAIAQHTGCTVYKLTPSDFHTLLTGEVATKCGVSSCQSTCGYDGAKRAFKEFCSKSCANSSGVIRQRREATMLREHGVLNAYQSARCKDKIKATNLSRYGVANASSSDQVKAKRRATVRSRYGVDTIMQSPELRARQQQAVVDRYGVTNVAKLETSKNKSKQTCLSRYGVEKVMHCQEIVERTHARSIKGSMEKYGVPNAMLHPEVLAKWQDSLGQRKQMEICGKTLSVQGYEQFAIEHLYGLKAFDSITTKMPAGALVPYTFKGKQRRYVPDAAIKMRNGSIRILGVKSWFTLRAEQNVPKFKAATEYFNARGMDFVLAIAEPENNYVRVVVNPSHNLEELVATAHLFSSGRRTW